MGIRVGSSFIRIARSRRLDQVVYLVKFPVELGSYKRLCKGFFSLDAAVTFARKIAAGLLAQMPASSIPPVPHEIGLDHDKTNEYQP